MYFNNSVKKSKFNLRMFNERDAGDKDAVKRRRNHIGTRTLHAQLLVRPQVRGGFIQRTMSTMMRIVFLWWRVHKIGLHDGTSINR